MKVKEDPMKGNRLFVLLAALIVVLLPLLVVAHHSMASYDQTTGHDQGHCDRNRMAQSPHVVTLSIQNAGGGTVMQRIEIAGPSALSKKGFANDLLKIGDSVTVEAWLPKNSGGNSPSGRWITLADGRRFAVGDNWGK
jgi:hypothetical protein